MPRQLSRALLSIIGHQLCSDRERGCYDSPLVPLQKTPQTGHLLRSRVRLLASADREPKPHRKLHASSTSRPPPQPDGVSPAPHARWREGGRRGCR
jgi:hypothetical protein